MSTLSSTNSTSFISAYWLTMRPYLLYVSGITGICGVSFAASVSPLHGVMLFAVFFFSYGFGQALTDCFQMDTDSISSPYRPLVRGIIRKNDVLITSLAGLVLCGIILGWFSLWNLFYAFFCIIGLASYTYFKKRWWGGPWYNSWIVGLLFIMGYNSVADVPFNQTPLPMICTLSSVFFGYANFVLIGYYKDVEADRRTGYNTFIVMFGRKATFIVCFCIGLIFIVSGITAVVLSVAMRPLDILLIAPIAASIAAVYYSMSSLYHLFSVSVDDQAYRAILPCIHSYISMFAAITAVNKPEWSIVLFVFYALYFYTINSRPEQTQI